MSEARQVQMRAVSGDEAGLRLDRWFQRHFPELSHGALQKLLRTGQVRLDGKRVEGKDRVEPGQTVRLPPGVTAAPVPSSQSRPKTAKPQLSERDTQEIQGLVIDRDDWVIALNKPSGLAVQGGSGTEKHVDGMLDGLRFGREERPRLVHRLDKDTSGLLLIAAPASRPSGCPVRRDRETEKLYWAVVVGVPPKMEGAIDLPLAKRPGARDRETMQVDHEEGQKALTHFLVMDRAGDRAALLALWPRTGRTISSRALRGDRLPDPGRSQVRRRGGALVGRRRFAPASPACAATYPAASVGQGHAPPAGRAAGAFQAHARGVRLLGYGGPMKIRIRISWRRLIWMMVALLPVLAIGGVIWLTTRDLTRYETRLTDQIRKVTGRELEGRRAAVGGRLGREIPRWSPRA